MSNIKINPKVDFLIKDCGHPVAVLIGGDNMLERFKLAISEHYVGKVTEVSEEAAHSGQDEYSEEYKLLVHMPNEDGGEDIYDFELVRIHCYYPEPEN